MTTTNQTVFVPMTTAQRYAERERVLLNDIRFAEQDGEPTAWLYDMLNAVRFDRDAELTFGVKMTDPK